jgi:glycosyltransferase involved in cell wall biosynthesis
MSANPTISVVIPTYNGTGFVRAALESVFAQTLLPLEVLVVDDASDDDILACVAPLTRTAPIPLRALRLPKNSGGPARPQNVGVNAASGDFIAVLDQDDVFLPTKLEEQSAVLQGDPRVCLVLSRRECQDASGRTECLPDPEALCGESAAGIPGLQLLPGPAFFRLLLSPLGDQLIGGFPSLLFRKRDWERKGGFDESLRIASDTDFVCWLCTQGPVAFFDRVHYRRRNHSTNLSNNRPLTFVEGWKAKCRYLRGEPALLADPEFSENLRQTVTGAAYWARRLSRYGDALWFSRILIDVWGWRFECLSALMKIALSWASLA